VPLLHAALASLANLRFFKLGYAMVDEFSAAVKAFARPEKKVRFTILSLFHNRYVCYAESLGPSVIKAYLKR